MSPRLRAALASMVRRLAHQVSRRPWMVRLAARVLARFPTLKHRVRRTINPPVTQPARREDNLSPGEAAVLADLRQAIADRGAGER